MYGIDTKRGTLSETPRARAYKRNKKIMPPSNRPPKVREIGQIDRSRANADEPKVRGYRARHVV